MKKKKQFNSIPLLVVVFFLFFGVYMYPYVADRWNAYRNSQLIAEYVETNVTEKNSNVIDMQTEMFLAAQDYNEDLAAKDVHVITALQYKKDAEYESLLRTNDDGMMGYIEIPKLQMKAPLYHYSDEDILDKGIGHIHGSSLPVGGSDTHCLLTGHRGLPYSKLFTDLDDVEVGDRFYIYTAGKSLAYEVFEIRTVYPTETEDLVIVPGDDLVTLVTCTPYGVNTHRLLVTGRRTEYHEDIRKNDDDAGAVFQAKEKATPVNALVLGLVVFVSILVVFMIVDKFRHKK